MTPEAATVTAIVLNWNGEHDTAACLDSLLQQRDVHLEIVLVDNDSADGSGERLSHRYPALTYIQTGGNLGYAGGNNVGLEYALSAAQGWILVINNDTIAAPDCVTRLVRAAESDARLAAVAPLIVRHDAPSLVWFAGGRHARLRAMGVHEGERETVDVVLARRADTHRDWLPCSFLSGCCLLLRPDALREVGLFRADFFAYVEDLELSVRLTNAGWMLGWVPDARLAHRVPPLDFEPSPNQIRLRDRNRRRLARDNYPVGFRFAFQLWFLPTRLVHIVRYVSRRDLARAKAILAGMTER